MLYGIFGNRFLSYFYSKSLITQYKKATSGTKLNLFRRLPIIEAFPKITVP